MARPFNARRGAGSTDHAPRDHYAAVTDQVIAALEAGTPPWRREWDPDKAGGPSMPCNASTGARYRGINVVTLGMSPMAFCSGDPRWATYRQAAERGWQVRKGEKSTTAYFFKRIEVRDTASADGEDAARRIPLLRAFALFHASQIDGVPDYRPPSIEEAPWRAPEAAEAIVANSGAVIRTGGDRAFYSPNTDHIQMPPKQAFYTACGWSSTIVHELAHWSGSPARLNRNMNDRFGSHDYAREEMRAEIATAMICSELAIPGHDVSDNAAYIASWLEKLRSDRKEIFRAAADAQRIADYLLAFHPAYSAPQDAAACEGDTPIDDPSGFAQDATPVAEAA